MPLPEPTLDNRRFDQLVAEGRALIPRLAPAWTDHNASDPGITLLELTAWLAEQNIFRFDRLSDEALRAFVRLVGIEPAPAGVAHTAVSVVNGNAAGVDLPARLQLGDAAGSARFETTRPVWASPARLVRLWCGRAGALQEVTADEASGSGFHAFGPRPRRGHVLLLGFDRALDAPGAPAGTRLSLYLRGEHWRHDAAIRDALVAEHTRQTQTQPAHCQPPPDWRLHYRVRCEWEFSAGGGSWLPMQEVEDETRALSLSGFVRFAPPVGHAAQVPAGEFLLRCRIVAGRFECLPRLLHVQFNAVPGEHALSVDDETLGTAYGYAGARFPVTHRPVVAGTVALVADDGVGNVQTDWQEAPDFDRAGAHERVFGLDAERGGILCGNGLRAQVLPAGHTLRASYRSGGGTAGNLVAGTLAQVPATPHNLALVPGLAALPLQVLQRAQASGGASRESLAAAQARAFDAVSEVDRAVTLADIERLALATPGVPVARVRAVANLAPHLPCWPAPGVVTLIVIPPCPRPAPLPSRALLAAVSRHLAARRLVTSEIVTIAPRYRRIGVCATLHLDCEAQVREVRTQAIARLDRFLDALEGGPDGTGWPFGRTVYRSEVMALLAATPGVLRVSAFGFSADGGCGASGCDNVVLCPHELIRAGRHVLVTTADAPASLRRSDPHECESS